ncbi:CRISPR-associated endoribonuclease Cas6 [Zhaonella formicivorans]|uniref:CRISPR-associated endoribonuclease Cas6 n=1 Tax=Zhaonella formicivorans TaxID=2528593 RepID=UPI0010EE5B32|nr:CRISPR-associated endoribonuclease Cas6 [Zhaonella formicivorans]
MQITLVINAQQKLVLPVQYNHILQGFIYNAISPELAAFLHEKGYEYGNRRFKLFAFSRLIGNYQLEPEKDRIIFSDLVKLVISSPVDEFCQSLANGILFGKYLRLGDNRVEIERIEVERQQVESQKITVKTLSPVVVYSTMFRPDGRKYTCYFQPGEPDYAKLVEHNLRKKYLAFAGQEAPPGEVCVRSMGQTKLHVLRYKDTVIKGYSGKLELTGPKELLQMAVDAGIGSKNSQGFGCVVITKNTKSS